MSRRRKEHDNWHEFKVLGAAIATLLFILAVSELTDTDKPPAPEPPQTVEQGRYETALSGSTSRSDGRTQPPSGAPVRTPTAAGRTGKSPVAVGSVLECIRWHESRNQYGAVNTSSGAAGAYQLMPEWSDDWAAKYGYPEWSHLTADRWPNRVQDAVAAALFADWPGAWSTLGACT